MRNHLKLARKDAPNMYFRLYLKHPGSIKDRRENWMPMYFWNGSKKYRNRWWKRRYKDTVIKFL